MARRFLWAVAILASLVVAGLLVWRLAAPRLLKLALIPSVAFGESPRPVAPEYGGLAAWAAHPALTSDPARRAPPGYRPAPRPPAALFFVHPTTFFARNRWNGPIDDAEARTLLDRWLAVQASPFNGVAEVWAPRYRQATLGALLTPGPDADRALALAEGDVARAFDRFLNAQPPGRPLFLAGHSQGARHLLHLLARRAGHPTLRTRIVAVYALGWPVVRPQDLELLGLPPCTTREQAGCVLSWQGVAADADPAAVRARRVEPRALDGRPAGGRALLCVNPLTGDAGAAGPEANPGTWTEGALQPRLVGARCDGSGLLRVAPRPPGDWPLVLPGGDFHAYDVHLFWAAVRADAEARLSAWLAERPAGRPAAVAP
ncbi:MAG: DUF3089 domain-containing protein [Thermaurantiacus sp.]|nr:DUF3089 domain-containing protein [Thermaurantiacus sp.]